MIRLERVRFERRVAYASGVGSILGFFVIVLGIIWGVPGPATLIGLALVAAGLVATQALRRRRGRALRQAEAALYWLGRRSLVDIDGRLTDQAQSIGDDDQVANAIAAYDRARGAAQAGKPWIPHLAKIGTRIDLSGELAELAARDRSERLSIGRWEWLIIGPLALIGLGLLALAVGVGILQALGLQ